MSNCIVDEVAHYPTESFRCGVGRDRPGGIQLDGDAQASCGWLQNLDGLVRYLGDVDRLKMQFDRLVLVGRCLFEYRWTFRVYEPGLWLFDRCEQIEKDGTTEVVASISEVKVNGQNAKVVPRPRPERPGIQRDSTAGG